MPLFVQKHHEDEGLQGSTPGGEGMDLRPPSTSDRFPDLRVIYRAVQGACWRSPAHFDQGALPWSLPSLSSPSWNITTRPFFGSWELALQEDQRLREALRGVNTSAVPREVRTKLDVIREGETFG